jgi:hypothetical protein
MFSSTYGSDSNLAGKLEMVPPEQMGCCRKRALRILEGLAVSLKPKKKMRYFQGIYFQGSRTK